MIDFKEIWIDFECPNCGFQIEVQLIDVKTEKTVFCHNCKANILLSDNEASTHTGIENMNKALYELEKTIKNFGK